MDRIVVARNASQGLHPHYLHEAGTAHAPRIERLFADHPELPRKIDAIGLKQYFECQPDGLRTCFEGILPVPPGTELRMRGGSLTLADAVLREPCGRSLTELLETVLDEMLARSQRPAFALSGGLDSALLLAVLRRNHREVPVCTFVTSIPGYCEREMTLATSRALGVPEVTEFGATAADFIEAVPSAITAGETPLYNLHPLSKWLFARELQARGFDTIITGDGADQVFAGSDGRNYLPIVGAMVRAAGITLASPFLDERVIALAPASGVDANKSVLRAAAAALLPDKIVHRPKTPCFMPDLDLSRFRDSQADRTLAGLLQIQPPAGSPDFRQTLWATATLLFQRLGGLG